MQTAWIDKNVVILDGIREHIKEKNSMEKGKITVIFPIFNNENYIEKCIRSVMEQTYHNLEMILIDDGSTDSAPYICDKLAEEDSRIRVIHKKNEGVAAGENLGLEIATGEYVGFVEADDYVVPDMYERLYEAAQKTDADIIKCGFYYNDGLLKEVTSFYDIAKDGEVFKAADKPLIFLHHASMWAGIYKMKFIKENGIKNIVTPSASYTDFSWMAKTYAAADSITIVHRPLYVYTYNNPLSSNKQDGVKCFYKPFHCLEANKILRAAGIFDKVKEEIGYHEFRTCLTHAKNIRADLRTEYFSRFREVLRDLCVETNFQFKHFSKAEQKQARLISEGKMEQFYKTVDFDLAINRIILPLKQIKILKKIKWKYLQYKKNK